ncbi:hypothetical protein F5Y09DRAFT_305207, partial [Xylaria sp. FL1042]
MSNSPTSVSFPFLLLLLFFFSFCPSPSLPLLYDLANSESSFFIIFPFYNYEHVSRHLPCYLCEITFLEDKL